MSQASTPPAPPPHLAGPPQPLAALTLAQLEAERAWWIARAPLCAGPAAAAAAWRAQRRAEAELARRAAQP